jgi:hypothetical protein
MTVMTLPLAISGLDRRFNRYGLTITSVPGENPPGIVVGVAVDAETTVRVAVGVSATVGVLVGVGDWETGIRY